MREYFVNLLPVGVAYVTPYAGLARHITAIAKEDPKKRYRNKSFAAQEQQDEAAKAYYEQEAAARRLKLQRDMIKRELRSIRFKYPCADDCELLERLIETNAHPQTIAAQRAKIERIRQGLEGPTPPWEVLQHMEASDECPCPEKEVEGPKEVKNIIYRYREDPELKNLAYAKLQGGGKIPAEFWAPATAADRMKALRERIARELREVREMYPCATECELVQRLIEMGAHPQVIEIQKKRAKQAGQAEAFQPQPRTRMCKAAPCAPTARSGKTGAIPRSRIPRAVSRIPQARRAVPRTSSAVAREVALTLQQESCPQEFNSSAYETPRRPTRPLERPAESEIQNLEEECDEDLPRGLGAAPAYMQETPPGTPRRLPGLERPTRRVERLARRRVPRRLFEDIGVPQGPQLPQRGMRGELIRPLQHSLYSTLAPVIEDKPHWAPITPFVQENQERRKKRKAMRSEMISRRYLRDPEDTCTPCTAVSSTPERSTSLNMQPILPSFAPDWSFSDLQNMIDEEKKEIRSMHAIVSQIMEPARQVQFKDMYTLVPHIFIDETETSPEVAAAILHSDEKGLSLKSTPAKLYDSLFQGGEADRTVMKVNAPSAHTKAGVLVPLSSEGVEASFIGYEPTGLYEVIPQQQGDTEMPSPRRESAGIGTIRENLGFSASSLSRASQISESSEDGQFKIILQPELPRENDFIQIRGSQPPPWFPGYFAMMGDNKTINVVEKPWTILEKAWREFVPQKTFTDTGKVIVGS